MQVKEETLIVRMKAEDRKKVATAAKKQRQSISDFVTNAALKEADKVLLEKEKTAKQLTYFWCYN